MVKLTLIPTANGLRLRRADTGGALVLATNPGDEPCCCNGFCCYCVEFDSYTFDNEVGGARKPFAGGIPDNDYVCFNVYQVNGNPVVVPAGNPAPAGGEFLYKECFAGFRCAFADAAWAGNPPFENAVNAGIDSLYAGSSDWTRGEKSTACAENITQEECERCRCQDGNCDEGVDPLIGLQDYCGIYHPPQAGKKCCETTEGWPPEDDNCLCDI